MDALEVVKTGLAAVENRQDQKYKDLIADDMVFAGPVPQPVGKDEFVAIQLALMDAMPDWKFNATDYKQMGDQVIANLHITGTQTRPLKLPMPGVPAIPPTGKHVSLPVEPTTFTVKGDKIARIDSEASPQSGVPGILSQLGISMPPM